MKKIFLSITLAFSLLFAAYGTSLAQATCGGVYDDETTACPSSCPLHSFVPPGDTFFKYCCGWVGSNGSCQAKEEFACGTGYDASRSNAACNSSCPANGTYLVNNTVMACCGHVYNNRCNIAPAQTISCGSGYDVDRSDAVCNSSCPANGTYTENATIKTCCGFVNGAGTACTATDTSSVACGTDMSSAQSAGKVCLCNPGFSLHNGNRACCGWWNPDTQQCSATQIAPTAACGAWWPTDDDAYFCPQGCPKNPVQVNGQQAFCCGFPTPDGPNPCEATPAGGGGPTTPGGVTNATFDSFNKAIFGTAGPDVGLTTPRGIISKLLPYLFTFAGLILFIMILWGGFEMLTGAADPKMQEAGKQRITAAVVGFLLLFSSYWLAQIVQRVFGISIL
jgi:hypothetical protein